MRVITINESQAYKLGLLENGDGSSDIFDTSNGLPDYYGDGQIALAPSTCSDEQGERIATGKMKYSSPITSDKFESEMTPQNGYSSRHI